MQDPLVLSPQVLRVMLDAAIEDSLRKLDSSWVEASLAIDPYWPKWDSPWWHMVTLWELGHAVRIPRRAVEAMTQALDRYYLHTFPLDPREVPDGLDPQLHVMCHCGLGTMYGLLGDCGVEVDVALPWARPWFARYQLADGGWNCDEDAYLRDPSRSSMVSTLPVLEALLGAKHLSGDEETMLDRGAAYLLDRRLCRSLSKGGTVIDESWLRPLFPRFYEYDVMRGLEWLQAWAERRRRPLPEAALWDARQAVARLEVRDFTAAAKTRLWDGQRWQRGVPATSFPLLEQARTLAVEILRAR